MTNNTIAHCAGEDMSDIEQEIQAKGLTAPRVTPADIEANIAAEHYFTAGDAVVGRELAIGVAVARIHDTLTHDADNNPFDVGDLRNHIAGRVADIAKPTFVFGGVPPELNLLTFCVLVLRNGFTVTGESACASPENFDAGLGRKIARQNAIAKIWPLMGYELRSKLASN
jgi:hypothetical protein